MTKHKLRLVGTTASASPSTPTRTISGASDDPANQQRARELDRLAGTARPKTVSVSAGDLIPLLMDAAENDRTWLRDFADDPVRIDVDLYDVLLAYQQLSNQRAA